MTALSALAAIYPPPPRQQWFPHFNWQPIPYDTAQQRSEDYVGSLFYKYAFVT